VNFLQQPKASGDIHTRKSSSHEAAGIAIELDSGVKDALAICRSKATKDSCQRKNNHSNN
jgi:hypothetical protein